MTIPTTPSTFPSQLNTSAMAGVNYSNFTLLASKLLLFPASLVSITHVISPVVFITLLRTKDKKKARSPVVLWGWAAGGGGWGVPSRTAPGREQLARRGPHLAPVHNNGYTVSRPVNQLHSGGSHYARTMSCAFDYHTLRRRRSSSGSIRGEEWAAII